MLNTAAPPILYVGVVNPDEDKMGCYSLLYWGCYLAITFLPQAPKLVSRNSADNNRCFLSFMCYI